MKLQNNVRTSFAFPAFILIMITIVFIANMLAITDIILPLRNLQYLLTVFIMIGFVAYHHNINCLSPIIFNTLVFSALIFISTANGYTKYFSASTMINECISALWWAVALITGYIMGTEYEDAEKKSSIALAIFIPVFFILFLRVDNHLSADNINFFLGEEAPSRALITSAYYLLCLLPFVFISNNKIIKTVLTILAGIAIVISAKRTGFIAFSAAVVTYMLCRSRTKSKNIVKTVTTLLSIAIIAFVIIHIIEASDFSILDRLSRLGEDQGSGRTEIYKITWELFKSSDSLPMLFGHGYDFVYFDARIGMSAHNDFLEVLYDYGIIGFLLYLNMYRIFIKFGRKLYKENSIYAPAVFSAVVIMLVLSIGSHLMIFKTYFIYLCLFFGLIFGIDEKKEKRNSLATSKYYYTHI